MVFAVILCWLKSIGVYDKDFWIKTDFLFEVRWYGGNPTQKISLVNMYLELKFGILSPLQGNKKRRKTNINPIWHSWYYQSNTIFSILARSCKFKKSEAISQKIKYRLPKTGSKITFVPHFYPCLMDAYT